MSNDLARARVRKAADEWLAGQEYQVPLPPKRIGLTPDSFRTFMLEAFVAGASYGDDEHTMTVATGQRQLDDATSLMREAVELFRSYEKHHKGEAFRLHCGSDAHRSRMAKAETNALMAARLEAWLAGEDFYPIKPGALSVEDQAAQEAFVSAALDAGIDQVSEADEPFTPDRNHPLYSTECKFDPADLDLAGADHTVEDCRQRFENIENFSGFVPVSVGAIMSGIDEISTIPGDPHQVGAVTVGVVPGAPLTWDGRSSTLENELALGVEEFARRQALALIEKRRAACEDASFTYWPGGDGPPADLDEEGEVLLDWGEQTESGPRFTICSVEELTPMPGLWGESIDLESFATIIGYGSSGKVPISTPRVRVPGVITESRQEITYEIEGGGGLDLTQPIWINGVPYLPAREFEAKAVLAKAETLIGEASEFIRSVTGANPGSDSEEMCQRLDAWPLSLATPAAPTAEEN